MKPMLAAGLSCCALLSAAHGQSFNEPRAWIRPLLGVGYSLGGQTLLPVTLVPEGTTTQYKEDVSAGAGIELTAGLVLQVPRTPFSVKATLGHHVDGVHGISARASFWRTPFEGGLQWHVNERATVGMGMRHAVRAKFNAKVEDCGSQGVTCADSYWLAGSYGWYLEGEWAASRNWGLRLQAVHESFTVKPPRESHTYKGDHVGVMSIFYFN